MEEFKRQRFKDRIPVWFILNCILFYNFRSFRRFLIYIYHFTSLIDLREKDSSQYTNEELIIILEPFFSEKLPKQFIRDIVGISKPTFNEHFKAFFEDNEFTNKRTFTVSETYRILMEWQGDDELKITRAVTNEDLASYLHSGNYKKAAKEFNLYRASYDIVNKNKYSPKEIKAFFGHIKEDFPHFEKFLKQKS